MILEAIKKLFTHNNIDDMNESTGEEKFKHSNALIVEKMSGYIPAMVMTNLSTLLLISVDGIVVGNFVSEEALSSVNIFYPASLLISVVATLLSIGVATALSNHIGKHDYENLPHLKSSVKALLIISIIVVSIVQIPIVNIIIASYNLSNEMYAMTYSYGIGIMILNPISIISTVGVYQLQIMGKMKVLLRISVMESILNAVLDLLFVGVFKMGVIGAGFGTATAGITRAIVTLIYLCKKTDIYESAGAKARISDIKEIISFGLPEAVFSIMGAFQNYFMMQILLFAFGDMGGSIKGVCTFAYNITNIFCASVIASARPLIGLFEGAEDTISSRNVMKTGSIILITLTGIMVFIIELNPILIYHLHGVRENISADNIMSVRIFALSFIFMGINNLLRLYLTNKRDTRFTSLVTIVNHLFLPVIAYMFYKYCAPVTVWCAHLVTGGVYLIIYIARYLWWLKKDIIKEYSAIYNINENEINSKISNSDMVDIIDKIRERLLYLSVNPGDAIEASRYIRKYAIDKGFSARISNHMSLCMEEMLNYAVKSQNNKDIHTQIIIRFNGDAGVFMMLDDGRCIALDNDSEVRELTIDNYTLLKKISKSYEYQYILDMNHTTFYF